MRILIALLSVLFLLIVAALVVLLLVLTPSDRRLLSTPMRNIDIDNEQRSYRLYNADKKSDKPLLISLHGYRDLSIWHAYYSGVHLLADDEDIALALPSGKQQSWNGTFCCGWSYLNKVDDVAFIEAMIEEIVQEYAIDTTRIYVVGFSNGGILAQKLLAERPHLFAAGTSVMSGVGSNSDQLDIGEARAPILLLNGTRDVYVPIEEPRRTNQFNFTPAFTTAEIWAAHYELDDKQKISTASYDEYTWGADGTQLTQRIYDTSHRWPDWRLWTLPNDTPQATKDIWAFMSQHQLVDGDSSTQDSPSQL